MATSLPRIVADRLTGSEPFKDAGRDLGFDVLSFWRWSTSDLLNNATRGVIAEFLVAQALGIAGDSIRESWDAFDLTARDGTKIEVKSASYVQSWYQRDYSQISFNVPETRAWDAQTNRQAEEPKRHADVYVFCLLSNRDQTTINPCDLAQWQFYVLPTSVLDNRKRSQLSITLKSLEALCPAVAYSGLATSIREAAALQAVPDRRSKLKQLVEALRHRTPEMERKLEELKEEGRGIAARKDMIWYQLVHSLATLQRSSGWENLKADQTLLDSISSENLSALDRERRHSRLKQAMWQAKVRMPDKKADWLLENFDRIEAMGGAEAATRTALALSSPEEKIDFMMAFRGIGAKYGRNSWMDLYDPDFRQSIAIDTRISRITEALGFAFRKSQYREHEAFFQQVAEEADLEPWELDRLLYQFTDHFLTAIEGPSLDS